MGRGDDDSELPDDRARRPALDARQAPDAQDGPRDVSAAVRRPRGRQEVREALLESAQRLIAEQGPSRVRLREIAESAGVNFGLVYQYLGTREDLLHAVYQRVSARSATRLEHIDQLADTISLFMTLPDDSIGRIMGWAALEGDYPAGVFGHSPALDQVASMMIREARQDGRAMPEEEARVLAAFIQVVALGWRLFRGIGLAAAGVEASADADRRVIGWLQMLAESVVHGQAPDGEPGPGPGPASGDPA